MSIIELKILKFLLRKFLLAESAKKFDRDDVVTMEFARYVFQVKKWVELRIQNYYEERSEKE